jgi:hypothetical protein
MSLRRTEYGAVAKGYDYDLWLLVHIDAPGSRRIYAQPSLAANLLMS